ncbi:hypothetical protein AD428_14060 [Achromobacter sp. DMS1]|uniref:hypothetical protein n=1 Tax=Achromobacter sp. DMS1 TaxID=1688405 RepID=UPI00069DDB53|nr:hypothetical protein [Achromobacter sp. DMS1]KOF53368.1 hypothetical protein AD428_14060 [Achromobacter sp. DMS1]
MNPVALQQGAPIKIAILAMGGQGGGVLADWIVDMAEHAGWWAQTTSVPGVAHLHCLLLSQHCRGQKATIIAQVGQIYSDGVGQYYTGANTYSRSLGNEHSGKARMKRWRSNTQFIAERIEPTVKFFDSRNGARGPAPSVLFLLLASQSPQTGPRLWSEAQ